MARFGREATFVAVAAAFCLAVLKSSGAQAMALGALKLDNYTFDKVLSIPGHSFLVKVDTTYAWGEKEDEFKVLCRLAYLVPGFYIAEVPVQEHSDMENDDLRQRFKLTKDDFPAYLLFGEEHKEGLRYKGEVKAPDIALWLRKQKIKFPSIGTITELDELVERFVKDGFAEVHLVEARRMAEQDFSTDAKAAMYPRIMQKLREKGKGYVQGELARVGKLLESKVTAEKQAELADKARVLSVFASKDGGL